MSTSSQTLKDDYLPKVCVYTIVDGFFLRNVAFHHLLANGSSAVNGCHQNESPNS